MAAPASKTSSDPMLQFFKGTYPHELYDPKLRRAVLSFFASDFFSEWVRGTPLQKSYEEKLFKDNLSMKADRAAIHEDWLALKEIVGTALERNQVNLAFKVAKEKIQSKRVKDTCMYNIALRMCMQEEFDKAKEVALTLDESLDSGRVLLFKFYIIPAYVKRGQIEEAEKMMEAAPLSVQEKEEIFQIFIIPKYLELKQFDNAIAKAKNNITDPLKRSAVICTSIIPALMGAKEVEKAKALAEFQTIFEKEALLKWIEMIQ